MKNNIKKKIVISSNTSWSVFNFRLELAKYLDGHFSVHIVAPKDEYSEILIAQGFKFHHIDMDPSSISPLKDIKTLIDYYYILNEVKPDFFLGFTAKPNIYGGFLASMLNIRVINNIAGLGRLFTKRNLLTNLMQYLYKVSLSKSHHIFFQNKDDCSLFLHEGVIDNKNHSYSVLPGSGVNTSRFVPVTSDVRLCKEDKFTFLFSARLLKQKGINEFIEVARTFKEEGYFTVDFLVLGKYSGGSDEIEKSYLDNAIEEGVINYLGTTDNIEAILINSDCFVLPSYYREGVPRSLLEAASSGLPVITTDSVGCRDAVIHNVTGFRIPVKDTKALYHAMKAILDMPIEKKKQMGDAGRRYMIEHFDEKIVFEHYQKQMFS